MPSGNRRQDLVEFSTYLKSSGYVKAIYQTIDIIHFVPYSGVLAMEFVIQKVDICETKRTTS